MTRLLHDFGNVAALGGWLWLVWIGVQVHRDQRRSGSYKAPGL